MNDNQEKLKSYITLIFTNIGKQADNIKTYQNELGKIVPLPYIEEEKERMRSKAQATMRQSTQVVYEHIQKKLDVVRATALAMESEFEITPDLQVAINLVSAVGNNLPFETRQNLVNSFIGRKQALIALQALFSSNGIDESESKKYIFDAANWCDSLDNAAFQLTVQPGKSVLPLVEFGKLLTEFAGLEGAELTVDISSYVDMDAYYMGLSRAAMGLPLN
ncbi:MAG: hypothetical protein VB096_10340 [Pseudoflavonifractor sp.]|nr:hypothetical protein [Pseudoflavonifractor sp.]